MMLQPEVILLYSSGLLRVPISARPPLAAEIGGRGCEKPWFAVTSYIARVSQCIR